VPELNKTFAELTLAEKNQISHRGRALAAFKALLLST
jgi:XTP/dITP diphosphohydrolase